MANFTKKAIKDTFIAMLEERPLGEITVKDLVETCGINRNSFYYHYADIPSLIEEIVREEADETIRQFPTVDSILECFDAIINFTARRKKAIFHIYRSVSRDVFEHYLMDLSEYFVSRYVDAALGDSQIRELDRDTIVCYYKCVCFGLVLDWLDKGMSAEYAKSIRSVFKLKTNLAQEFGNLIQMKA